MADTWAKTLKKNYPEVGVLANTTEWWIREKATYAELEGFKLHIWPQSELSRVPAVASKMQRAVTDRVAFEEMKLNLNLAPITLPLMTNSGVIVEDGKHVATKIEEVKVDGVGTATEDKPEVFIPKSSFRVEDSDGTTVVNMPIMTKRGENIFNELANNIRKNFVKAKEQTDGEDMAVEESAEDTGRTFTAHWSEGGTTYVTGVSGVSNVSPGRVTVDCKEGDTYVFNMDKIDYYEYDRTDRA